MKYNLPCEILRDLLPSYIDNLSNEVTAEAVKEHLAHCKECRNVYETMKNDCRNSSSEKHSESKSGDDKELFKKINKKLNKRTKAAVIAGIAAVIVVLGGAQLLFNTPLKNIPVEEVSATASVYPTEEIASKAEADEEFSVNISKDPMNDNYQPEFVIEIPGTGYDGIGVSQGLLDSCEYVSLISFDSPYVLDYIDSEYKTENGKTTLYIYAFKTTILNNKTSSMNTSSSTLQFANVDKIVYVDENGSNTIMWENK